MNPKFNTEAYPTYTGAALGASGNPISLAKGSGNILKPDEIFELHLRRLKDYSRIYLIPILPFDKTGP